MLSPFQPTVSPLPLRETVTPGQNWQRKQTRIQDNMRENITISFVGNRCVNMTGYCSSGKTFSVQMMCLSGPYLWQQNYSTFRSKQASNGVIIKVFYMILIIDLLGPVSMKIGTVSTGWAHSKLIIYTDQIHTRRAEFHQMYKYIDPSFVYCMRWFVASDVLRHFSS